MKSEPVINGRQLILYRCRPLLRAQLFLLRCPGAHAPGSMLTPAIAGCLTQALDGVARLSDLRIDPPATARWY
jgi:hypothetical protein